MLPAGSRDSNSLTVIVRLEANTPETCSERVLADSDVSSLEQEASHMMEGDSTLCDEINKLDATVNRINPLNRSILHSACEYEAFTISGSWKL